MSGGRENHPGDVQLLGAIVVTVEAAVAEQAALLHCTARHLPHCSAAHMGFTSGPASANQSADKLKDLEETCIA